MARKFGIIGCQHSHIGEFIEEMLALGYECAGIYDPQPTHVTEAVMNQFRLPLTDRMEPLLGPDIAVIGCASINNEKIDIIETCEKFGKPVMLDKPIATNCRALERLQTVLERGRIQVGLRFGYYFSPAAYTLKRLIDRGELGKIVHIGIREPHRLSKERRPDWHFSKERCGGIVIDLLIHDFGFLRWLTGKEIVSVAGYMGKNMLPEHPDFYDVASFQALLEGGVTAQMYADWHTPARSWTWGDERIFVVGTEGTAEIRLNGDPLVSEESLLICTTDLEPVRSLPLEPVPVTATEDFLGRLEGKPAIVGHAEIFEASRAAIEADERAQIFNTCRT